MKVKLKKNVTVKEHGLMGRAGDQILVSRIEAQHLLKRGLVTSEDEVPSVVEEVDEVVETLEAPPEESPKTRKPRKKKSE